VNPRDPGAVPPPALAVHGGAGGTAARLDDLEAAGACLREAAGAMARIAVEAAGIAADPACAVTAVASPVTWWEAERSLASALAGRAGAVLVAARFTGLSAGAGAAVAAYRGADAAAAAVVRAVDTAAGEAAGRFLAGPLVIAAVATAPLLARSGADLPAVAQGLADLLAAHPGVVEHVVDAAPGAAQGFLGASPLLALLAVLPDNPAVPLRVPSTAGWIGTAGRVMPWLREPDGVTVRQGPRAAVVPPGGLADLVGGIVDLDPAAGAPPGTVRVTALRAADGRRSWVVQIPGTQSWSPVPRADPFDLTGNVHAMAGRSTAGGRTVTAALTLAGARPGEPVLLAGHSQGGMVAAQLAADPAFRSRFTVTHVVTAGSPIAAAPIPASVAVLSLEHDHDLVPRLDGEPNPDRAGWVTVSAAAEPPGGAPDAVSSHEAARYADTAAAVDASSDEGLRRWRAGLAPFVAGDGVTATAVLVTGERAPAS